MLCTYCTNLDNSVPNFYKMTLSIGCTLYTFCISRYQYVSHSRRKQRSGRRVLVYTLKFLALKKIGFSEKKNSSPPKK